MRLQQVELYNFRSFFGSHTLKFASEEGKAVTVFHGENGAGKTNLLNAIHWCITGSFTPRFQDTGLLVNKEAARSGERETFVELVFSDAGEQYRARRTSRDGRATFDLFAIKGGNSTPISNGERVLQRIIPKGLVSWFFFDAEAIGSLELSGSDSFKNDLRRTLGFELVDRLIKDLEACKIKKQREVSTQTNDRELKELQDRIEDKARMLPIQKQKKLDAEQKIKTARARLDEVERELRELPQTSKLQVRRASLETQKKRSGEEKGALQTKIAVAIGAAAPAIFIKDIAIEFEKNLQVQETKGKLPSPYSDQLVKEILDNKKCICGRPVLHGTDEENCINGLLKFANTSVLNQRIKNIQYLIRTVEDNVNSYPVKLSELRQNLASVDKRIGDIEDELRDIAKQMSGSNEAKVRALEGERDIVLSQLSALNGDRRSADDAIAEMQRTMADLQLQYDRAASKLQVGERHRKELGKITRLLQYLQKSLKAQEERALRILGIELNRILQRYLTKHYQAQITPSNYAVKLLDEHGKQVGHSTGEGQILKFAFISTVVALAARKTQEKIAWMAEPTIAPLVLDAPFSALDPEYQGSVARNLAAQTTQLVLMVSSAGWFEPVSKALEPFVGQRYLVVSKSAGPRGEKPVKRMTIAGRDYELNQYDAPRSESEFVEIK